MPDEMGRPTSEHELNRQLADTIGASVEQLLGITNTEADNGLIDNALMQARQGGTIGGQPAGGGVAPGQPAGSGQPAPTGSAPGTVAQPVTPQDGEIDWEGTKAPNGLYLGKYPTRDAAVKGVAHAVAMAKNALSRSAELERQLQEERKQNEQLRNRPVATPVTTPQAPVTPAPSRGQEGTPSPVLAEVLAKLQDGDTLNAEDLAKVLQADRESVLQQARQIAREEYEGRNAAVRAEQERWGKVEAYMAEKHPESVNFTDELALYVQSHPMIAAGVQALIAQDRHEEATEAAWAMFAREHDVKPAFKPAPATEETLKRQIQLEAADQVRREAVAEARKDAGVIGAGAGGHGVHESANTGPTQDEYDHSVALMRQGDGRAWRNIVFGDSLNHPLLNG